MVHRPDRGRLFPWSAWRAFYLAPRRRIRSLGGGLQRQTGPSAHRIEMTDPQTPPYTIRPLPSRPTPHARRVQPGLAREQERIELDLEPNRSRSGGRAEVDGAAEAGTPVACVGRKSSDR